MHNSVNIKNRIHGLISIALLDLAAVVAIYAIAKDSLFMAGIYLLITLVCFGLIIYAFCGKCQSRKHCGHVIFGPLTKKLPQRTQSPYSFSELLITITALAVIFGFPQLWLWNSVTLGIAYWGMTLFSLIEITQFVCPKCDNSRCPVCKKKLVS